MASHPRLGGLPSPPRSTSWRHQHRSEEHTSELQSQSNLVCRLLLEKKKSNRQGVVARGLQHGRAREPCDTMPRTCSRHNVFSAAHYRPGEPAREPARVDAHEEREI